MRRVGPWVLGAGMALMVAGIASSGLDLWPSAQTGLETAVPVPAGGAIDIQGVRVDSITVEAREDALLRYTRVRAGDDVDEAPPVAWRQQGDVRVLEGALGYDVARQVQLEVPARLSRLAGQSLDVKANARVEALRVEGTSVTWDGDAGTLLLQAVPMATSRCGGVTRVSSTTFTGGEVQALRIVSAQGVVSLGDLARVGDVELRLAPDVRLQVARVADLEQIRILPYVGEVPVDLPDGDGNDSRGAAMACAALRSD